MLCFQRPQNRKNTDIILHVIPPPGHFPLKKRHKNLSLTSSQHMFRTVGWGRLRQSNMTVCVRASAHWHLFQRSFSCVPQPRHRLLDHVTNVKWKLSHTHTYKHMHNTHRHAHTTHRHTHMYVCVCVCPSSSYLK